MQNQNQNSFVNQAYVSDENGHNIINIKRQESQITYSWVDVNVFAKPENLAFGKTQKWTEKQILTNVTGICRPGELLAIMGASGAGKTTLLNVLTARSGNNLRVEGSLFLNGRKMSIKDLTKRSAYVQQDDMFINVITVREQLVFQATLRMDKEIPMNQRIKRVDEVIEELGLSKCRNTLIGDPIRVKGISGGEMKRLAFACEVLTEPSLMFCDEPTSGLDSFTAQNVVSVMKDLANKGKSIISTIHQPSSQVFAMFDRVLLLAEGRTAYLGDVSNALKFFSRMGRTCPIDYNPADFFISTLAIRSEDEVECKKSVKEICDGFDQSVDMQEIRNATQSNIPSGESKMQEYKVKKKESPYKAGRKTQFLALLQRTFREMYREPLSIRVKAIQVFMISLIVCLVYADMSGIYTQSSVQNVNGCLFILVTNVSFMFCFGVVNTFCSNIPLFLREHFNGMYRVDVFYLAKSIIDIPATIIFPLFFVLLIYYFVNFYRDASTFLTLFAAMCLSANCSLGFGYMISAISSNINIALAIAAPLMIPFMIFGGYFLNTGSIPKYLIWFRYISWFNYANEAAMIAQWRNVEDIECREIGFDFCSGKEVIEFYSYDQDNLWFDFLALVLLTIFYRGIAYLALLRRTYQKV